jgi:hypothetical protein
MFTSEEGGRSVPATVTLMSMKLESMTEGIMVTGNPEFSKK